jgi:cell division protein FtsI/penicillin-binding protein 2
MEEAIALSCNAYFRALVSDLDTAETGRVVQSLGVAPPPAGASRDSLFGIGDDWRIAPLPLARAYIELLSRAHAQRVDEISEGMSMAVKQGTAAAARGTYTTQLLGKTGTAPCSHAQKAPGDGLTMLLYPASSPRLALLLRAHGHPGSQAAATGGRMIEMVISGAAGGRTRE